MKKIGYIILLLIAMVGCNDHWDDFYGEGEDERMAAADMTLYDALKQHERFSRFVQLLDETGLSRDLQSERVLTAWVPEDNYITDDIMELDSLNKHRFVLNHLNSLALYRTKLASKNEIRTLAGKYVTIAGSGNSFTIDKIKVKKFDQVCTNGVFHEISGILKPIRNVMEYLLEAGDDYSIFRDSLLAYNDTVFRPDLSYAIGVDDVGQTIYDSVFDIKNKLLNTIDFANEKAAGTGAGTTLFLPSNRTIAEMLEDVKSYFEALDLEMKKSDTLTCFDFLLKGSFMGTEILNMSGAKSIRTAGGKVLHLDKQLISTNYEKCSNGVVYRFERAYVPRGTFMKKLEFSATSMFDLPEEEWPSYYRLSYGGTLNNTLTNSQNSLTENIFADANNKSWTFLNVKANKGEWVELVLLQKNINGRIEPARLMPGKYKLTGKGYSWNAANVRIYLNGNPLIYTGEKAPAYTNTAVFPMGQRNVAFAYEGDKYQPMCDTIEVGVHSGYDVVRLESAGSGQLKNSIKIRALLFEPVGENY